MGIFNLFGKAKKQDPDEQVIVQLEKAGSNLSLPHNIEFFLYFPSEEAANESASEIEPKGFKVEVKNAATGSEWLCFANKKMIPSLENLQETRIYFDKITASLGGEYDGWGTEIEN